MGLWIAHALLKDPASQIPPSKYPLLHQAALAACDAADGLLAYEGFDYRDPNGLEAGTAAGGFGWVGAWTPGFARAQVPVLDTS